MMLGRQTSDAIKVSKALWTTASLFLLQTLRYSDDVRGSLLLLFTTSWQNDATEFMALLKLGLRRNEVRLRKCVDPHRSALADVTAASIILLDW
jgi:hypothetical protein